MARYSTAFFRLPSRKDFRRSSPSLRPNSPDDRGAFVTTRPCCAYGLAEISARSLVWLTCRVLRRLSWPLHSMDLARQE